LPKKKNPKKKKNLEQQETSNSINDNDAKWSHDRFDESQQMPKSKTELVKRYGYDIRETSSSSKQPEITAKAKPNKPPPPSKERDTNNNNNQSRKENHFGQNKGGRIVNNSNSNRQKFVNNEYDEEDESNERGNFIRRNDQNESFVADLRRKKPAPKNFQQTRRNADQSYNQYNNDNRMTNNNNEYSQNNRSHQNQTYKNNENFTNSSELPKRYSSMRNQHFNNNTNVNNGPIESTQYHQNWQQQHQQQTLSPALMHTHHPIAAPQRQQHQHHYYPTYQYTNPQYPEYSAAAVPVPTMVAQQQAAHIIYYQNPIASLPHPQSHHQFHHQNHHIQQQVNHSAQRQSKAIPIVNPHSHRQ
jgi:hypothetical protein